MAQANLVSATVRAVKSATKFVPRRTAIDLVSTYKIEVALLCMRCS